MLPGVAIVALVGEALNFKDMIPPTALQVQVVSADTTNGQFLTGTSQNTGVLPAGRISIREVTTKRGIYLTPRCPGLGERWTRIGGLDSFDREYDYSGRARGTRVVWGCFDVRARHYL